MALRPKPATRARVPAKTGPKPAYGETLTTTFTFRLTEQQRDKLSRLGGPEWIRARIDMARE